MNVSHICDEGKREREILVGIPFKAVLQDQVSKVATVISMIGWCINTNFATVGKEGTTWNQLSWLLPFCASDAVYSQNKFVQQRIKKKS